MPLVARVCPKAKPPLPAIGTPLTRRVTGRLHGARKQIGVEAGPGGGYCDERQERLHQAFPLEEKLEPKESQRPGDHDATGIPVGRPPDIVIGQGPGGPDPDEVARAKRPQVVSQHEEREEHRVDREGRDVEMVTECLGSDHDRSGRDEGRRDQSNDSHRALAPLRMPAELGIKPRDPTEHDSQRDAEHGADQEPGEFISPSAGSGVVPLDHDPVGEPTPEHCEDDKGDDQDCGLQPIFSQPAQRLHGFFVSRSV